MFLPGLRETCLHLLKGMLMYPSRLIVKGVFERARSMHVADGRSTTVHTGDCRHGRQRPPAAYDAKSLTVIRDKNGAFTFGATQQFCVLRGSPPPPCVPDCDSALVRRKAQPTHSAQMGRWCISMNQSVSLSKAKNKQEARYFMEEANSCWMRIRYSSLCMR